MPRQIAPKIMKITLGIIGIKIVMKPKIKKRMPKIVQNIWVILNFILIFLRLHLLNFLAKLILVLIFLFVS